MRTLCVTALLLLAAYSPAAPALGEKPPRWEYAELSFRNLPPRPGLTDGNGNEIPATPATTTAKFISAAGEVDAKSWAELADKLKATSFKKDGSAAFLKIQFLNFLGSEGWELMEQSGTLATGNGPGTRGTARMTTASNTWLLKRRVP